MKIFTKTGDQGTTSLVNNTRVPKNHPRVEAYGTVDELNTHIGMLRDMSNDECIAATLFEIQKVLFVVQTRLAIDPEKPCSLFLPDMRAQNVDFLEKEIDSMQSLLGEFKAFLIPGGHPILSQCHIARCVCRRAERKIVNLSQQSEVESLVLQYINRLSDYLFVLARFFTHKLNLKENLWEE
jgi:cob(I)alamin adenosyltransferase